MSEHISLQGKPLQYNDCVSSTTARDPDGSAIKGRLLQIREKVGAFGTSIYFIRTPAGKLRTVANDILQHVTEELPALASDTQETTYTIGGKYPETGFLIEEPNQPKSPIQSFTMCIRHG